MDIRIMKLKHVHAEYNVDVSQLLYMHTPLLLFQTFAVDQWSWPNTVFAEFTWMFFVTDCLSSVGAAVHCTIV